MNQPLVKIENGKSVTTSVAVADYFGKKHNNVMRDIRNILDVCSETFSLLNFEQRTYQNSRGQTQPCFFLTKSGFAMTALGFTGKKAIEFREAYITRFDEMEAKLAAKEMKKLELSYVRDRYLPFDEPVIRESVTLSDACKHLRILGVYLTLTPAQLKGKIKRGEVEGHQDGRGFWRIYVDEVTRMATGH